MNKKETISIIFPNITTIMGGVESLLLKIIPEIVRDNEFQVRIYDYNCGLIYNKIKERNLDVEYIMLDGHDKKIPNKGNETFLLFGAYFLFYAPYLSNHNNVKILSWDVLYEMWDSFGKIKGVPIPFLKDKIIDLMNDTNFFIFMEKTSLIKLKKTKLHSEEMLKNNIVPVPISLKENSYTYKKNNLIKIGYIGRAVGWKIYPVKKLVQDLSQINGEFELNIYTNDSKNFEEALSYNSNITIKYHIGFVGDNLNEHIRQHIDLGYSMGTSALEFAKIGIPTVLADFYYSDFPTDYKYRWLKDTEVGNLGLKVDSELYNQTMDRRKSFKEILVEFRRTPILLSNQSYDYVMQNHDINKVKKSLYQAIRNTQLRSNVFLNFFYKCLAFRSYFKRVYINKNRKYVWMIVGDK